MLYAGRLGPACELHGADIAMIIKKLFFFTLIYNWQNILSSPHGAMCVVELGSP